MFKKILLITAISIFLPFFAFSAPADRPINIYLFYSETCPHCHDEALFLSKLKSEMADKINVLSYEVTTNAGNAELLNKFGKKYQIDLSQMYIPVTFIGEQGFVGYGSDEFEGAKIRNLVEQCLNLDCQDFGQDILNQQEQGQKNNKVVIGIIVGTLIIVGLVFFINKNKIKN